MTIVPNELLVALKDNVVIKGKQIVTEVFLCNGYVQYMSDGGESCRYFDPHDLSNMIDIGDYTISVALGADAIAAAVGAPVSGSANASAAWQATGVRGLFRRAYNKNRVFVPLFCLKSFRRRFFGRRDLPDSTEEE